MNWMNLIGNKDAKELYNLVHDIHHGDSSEDKKKKVNELADKLIDQGFTDPMLERYVDWVEVNRNLGNSIENL